jgi:hypothetical protein
MKNNEGIDLVFAFLIGALVVLFILDNKLDTLREEAVKRGYAEWAVDASGETEWRWKGGSHE